MGKRSKSNESWPATCPICGSRDRLGNTCERCDTALYPSKGSSSPPNTVQVHLCGKISSPVESDGAQGAQERRVFDVTLKDGSVVGVEVGPAAKILRRVVDEARHGFVHGQKIELLGEAHDRFDEEAGGMREAARVEHVMRPTLIALGHDAARLMTRAMGVETRYHKRLDRGDSPPEGLQLWWDAEGPEGRRLLINHRRGSLSDQLSGVATDTFIGAAACYMVLMALSLITGGTGAAFSLLGMMVYLLPLLPLVLYLVLVRRVGGVRISVDAERISVKPAPLPFFGHWNVDTARVRVVVAEGKALDLELDDGKKRRLIAKGRGRHIDYARELIDKALLDGLGEWAKALTKPPPSRASVVKQVLLFFAPLLPLLIIGTVIFTPTCLLTSDRGDLAVVLARAEKCALVTDRLGKNLTWAVGCNSVRRDEGKYSLMIHGDRERAKLFFMVEHGRIRFATVTVGEDRISVFRCSLWRKRGRAKPRSRKR